MWRSSLYRQSLCMWSAATGGNTDAAFFSSFATVRISKCASGGEIEVFIITLYHGNGGGFESGQLTEGLIISPFCSLFVEAKRKDACEGQILLASELPHFLYG